MKKAKYGDEYVVRVEWEGLEAEEVTWKLVSRAFADALTILRKKELIKKRPEAKLKHALNARYPKLHL